MKNKDILYKSTLFDAGIELQKIRNLITPAKAKKLRKILLAKISYEQKIKKFEKYKEDLTKAETHFVKFVKFLNKSSTYKGYKNFIEEIKEKSNTPDEKLKGFITNSNEIISFINKKVKFKKEIPKEYWSEYYLPFPACKSQKTYDIEEIYKIWQEMDPEASKIIEKIKIKKPKKDPQFIYHKDKDLFEIQCNLETKTIPEIFTFTHELGHCKHQALLLKKDNKEIGRYQKEKHAYEFSLELMKKITHKDEFWPYLWFKTKELIINGLFEYYIYTKDINKPAQLYANLHNKFHRKKIQKENYYYLTIDYLLFENGRMLTAAIPFVEAFKKVILP